MCVCVQHTLDRTAAAAHCLAEGVRVCVRVFVSEEEELFRLAIREEDRRRSGGQETSAAGSSAGSV